MNIDDNLIIMPARWDDYYRFKPLCCVDTMPYPHGPCWILGLKSVDDTYWIDPDIGFIGYNWPYRYNSVRPVAIPEFGRLPPLARYNWLNKHVRTLSRIMIRPAYRGKGYASYLLNNTLALVNIDYIECLTFTESIAHILARAGFKNYGKTGGMECDYYLWHNPCQANA